VRVEICWIYKKFDLIRKSDTQIEEESNESHANYLYVSALLFTIGAVGVVVRRNAIVVFMCIELMLNAANLSFVTFSRINGDLMDR